MIDVHSARHLHTDTGLKEVKEEDHKKKKKKYERFCQLEGKSERSDGDE
jgi:hypothetical protein